MGCTIRIYLFKKDTNVIVEIKDNGQGASPEKITELNELSFKNIDISKIRTTGIGLKISKQIVDLHQGSISFASVQNEFFESIISLPIFNITNQIKNGEEPLEFSPFYSSYLPLIPCPTCQDKQSKVKDDKESRKTK